MKNKSNKAGDLDPAAATSKHVPAKAESIQVTKSSENNDALDDEKKELLAECETDIEKNLRGTFVVGWRLEQIRDQRLYTATHKTFDEYCRERWDFSKTHANRHIQAYLCEKHLKEVKDVEVYVPTKESQIRWICDLEPGQQVEVAAKVLEMIEGDKASAGDFGKAREELYPKPKREAKAAAKTDKKDTDDAKTDAKVIPVKFDTNLVSLAELKKRVDHVYNIYANPTKKQEALKVIGTLQRDLDLWADWQAAQADGKEAA